MVRDGYILFEIDGVVQEGVCDASSNREGLSWLLKSLHVKSVKTKKLNTTIEMVRRMGSKP